MEKTIEEQAAELRAFFQDAVLSAQLNLSPGVRIVNMRLFLDNQFHVIESDNGLVVRRPALDRLLLLKSLVEKSQQE